MNLRDLLSHPLSSARDWIAGHERFFAVHLSWALAVLFIGIAVYKLFHSLGLL